MIPTTAVFNQEKNKLANQPIFLYTIHDYDNGGNNLYLAEYPTNIVYDGITYLTFPISHEYVGDNSQGEIEYVSVKISNVNRLIQYYLETYELRGKKVTIRLVWANQLADADAHMDHVFYIDSYTAGQDEAEFNLAPKIDILDINLPMRSFSRNYCGWKFKSTECGYGGVETSCNKTKSRCKGLGNYSRFGGFPSIPSQRVYL